MTKQLISEGGPHSVKNLGNDQYRMAITIPTDEDGRLARECPNALCSPAYFKITPEMGIINQQAAAYCPYCRHETHPDDFTSQEQIRYAQDIALREIEGSIDEMINNSLGLGPSGKKKIGGGFISMEISYKSSSPRHVRRPYEDEVRRYVVCPHCTLDQTVFGLATWCSDCWEDIFLTHVGAEISVTRNMLKDVGRREKDLGKRVAAKDIENCLEDAVSIFEASMKALVRRVLSDLADDPHPQIIDAQIKKIGNSFQNTERSMEQLKKLFNYLPSQSDVWGRLNICFEKRHPVTHNLGVIDRKHLERAQDSERVGREVRISESEVANLLDDIFIVISDVHKFLTRSENSSFKL